MTATESVRSDGTNGKSACAPVGHDSGPNRSDAGAQRGNGFDGSRVPAPVGPDAAAGPHGANGPSASRVGPILDGNTDTRGLVPPEEREHLQAFGSDLRTMRKAAGLTQERLGKLAGAGTTHISRLEQGRRRPSVDAIKALARILAPAGTADAVEQRWAALAGDSLREGTARRKRRADNRHRREAAAELTRATAKMRRLIRDKERRGLPVSETMRRLADFELGERLRPVDDEPGIVGVEVPRSPRDAREEVRELIRSLTGSRRRR